MRRDRQLNFIVHWVMILILLGGPRLMAARAEPHSPLATFLVTKTADTNDGLCDADCSLREAILAANAQPGADSVIVPAGIYMLTIPGVDEDAGATGDLDITDDLTLTGAGAEATVIDGGGIDRVIEMTGTVTLDGISATRGNSLSDSAGIQNNGTLTLTNSSVVNNVGRGVRSYKGILVVLNSTISGNTRGGISIFLGSALIQNSQITTNTWDLPYPSSDSTGVSVYAADVSFIDSLLSNNVNSELYAWYTTGGVSTIANSIVVNNSGGMQVWEGNAIISNSSFLSNTANSVGGAIRFESSLGLTVTNSLFMSNTFTGQTAMFGGGAIMNYLGQYVLISNSMFLNNYSISLGGAFFNSSPGGNPHIIIENSTFSGNHAAKSGGAIWGFALTPLELSNLTIVDNEADSDNDGVGDGGGLYLDTNVYTNTVANLSNILLAGNSDSSGEAPDCSGTLISLGYNLIQDTTGCVISGTLMGVITGTDPMLGPLQDNGGDTLTHALLPGSPAIDAGNPLGCLDAFGLLLLTDQRGYARHVDGGSGTPRCDLGAYEYNALPVTSTPTPTPTPTLSPTLTPSPTHTPTPTHTPSPTSTPTGGQSPWLYLPILYRSP